MCSFMEMFLQRSVHLLFSPVGLGRGGALLFLFLCLLRASFKFRNFNHHETATVLSRGFMSTGKCVFSWYLVG